MEKKLHRLHTGCILEPTTELVRVSVMSRHTDAGGKNPNPAIREEMFDRWWPELGPQPKTIGAYLRGELGWDRFEEDYLRYLENDPQQARLAELMLQLSFQEVVVMCIEVTPEKCHRRLLAQKCQEMRPELTVVLK